MRPKESLHPDRLRLPGEDQVVLAKRWARYQASSQRPLDLPEDIRLLMDRLAPSSHAAASMWLEALLQIDLHGRMFLETTYPLAAWFSSAAARSSSGNLSWEVPEAWVEDLRSIEPMDDAQLGLAIRRRLIRQLLGQESPADLERIVGPQWQVDDSSLTIWLPEKALSEARLFAEHLDFTVSDLVRNTLFLHLWGRVGYTACLGDERWRQRRRSHESDVRISFSIQRVRVPEDDEAIESGLDSGTDLRGEGQLPRRVVRIAEHGKSAQACKVWLPAAMKRRLTFLAQDAGLRTSDHCRNVLLRALYGHRSSVGDQT